MIQSSILEVAIGLFFVFLLYSLLATALREMIAGALDQRAKTLYQGISTMLTKTELDQGKIKVFLGWLERGGKNVVETIQSLWKKSEKNTLYEKFYNHPIIKNYGQNYLYKKPSYISPQNFSSILLDVIKDLKPEYRGKALTIDMVEEVLKSEKAKDGTKEKKIIDDELNQILQFHLQEAGRDIDVFKARLEKWFNDSMDRVSGWYKRNNQYWLFAIGFFLSLTFNLDTIEIAEYLSSNHEDRKALVEMAGTFVETYPVDSLTKQKLGNNVLTVINSNIKPVTTIVGLGWGDFGRSDSLYIKRLKTVVEPSSYHQFMAEVPILGAYSKMKMNVYGSLNYALKDSLKKFIHAQPKVALTDSVKKGIDSVYADIYAHREVVYAKKFDQQIFPTRANDFRVWYVMSELGWRKFFSFFITSVAIGLGAPFWFDILSRLTRLRSTGKAISTTSTSDNPPKENP